MLHSNMMGIDCLNPGKGRLITFTEKVSEMQHVSKEAQSAMESVAAVNESNHKNVGKINSSANDVSQRIQALSNLAQMLNSHISK